MVHSTKKIKGNTKDMNRSQCLRLKELSYLSWVVVRQKNSSKLFRGGMSLILQNVLGTV